MTINHRTKILVHQNMSHENANAVADAKVMAKPESKFQQLMRRSEDKRKKWVRQIGSTCYTRPWLAWIPGTYTVICDLSESINMEKADDFIDKFALLVAFMASVAYSMMTGIGESLGKKYMHYKNCVEDDPREWLTEADASYNISWHSMNLVALMTAYYLSWLVFKICHPKGALRVVLTCYLIVFGGGSLIQALFFTRELIIVASDVRTYEDSSSMEDDIVPLTHADMVPPCTYDKKVRGSTAGIFNAVNFSVYIMAGPVFFRVYKMFYKAVMHEDVDSVDKDEEPVEQSNQDNQENKYKEEKIAKGVSEQDLPPKPVEAFIQRPKSEATLLSPSKPEQNPLVTDAHIDENVGTVKLF